MESMNLGGFAVRKIPHVTCAEPWRHEQTPEGWRILDDDGATIATVPDPSHELEYIARFIAWSVCHAAPRSVTCEDCGEAGQDYGRPGSTYPPCDPWLCTVCSIARSRAENFATGSCDGCGKEGQKLNDLEHCPECQENMRRYLQKERADELRRARAIVRRADRRKAQARAARAGRAS